MKDARENLTMTTALNLDIYTHLLMFISSPADLLAVALTSCDLFHVGMPELCYCSIRVHLGNIALWRYLAENRQGATAREIRDVHHQQNNITLVITCGPGKVRK
ncbi:uncharacterized protein LACBIDRAFT_311159 [Laccaria bicolor S238N-H82]|uniref:Predicted protein n=1 Tax=Laccaria bicolor (strain S238N-H82 / ATCC MYA-4686) TaxID=486041 RepID=B0CZD2_LACBS|nr:uncharacterized protein LACBIDRAFT_311159 [Laccaria bicolor S238N-H82]EDR12600.1 predicted protein [Laccaria bicolor S238N-H82]|eukprot:XP_001876864.1 predicted protein [Laccaria bicolor S238N-H82]